MWCGECYERDEKDKFVINEPVDDEGHPIYDNPVDVHRYKRGTNGAHLVQPFQCDLCIFRNLFKRDPVNINSDKVALITIRRMNLDLIWSREPNTIGANIGYVRKIVQTAQKFGFTPNLPPLGPHPLEDVQGLCVAFTMLQHSLQPGRHSALYTQFATIRKSRAAFSNLFQASKLGVDSRTVISKGTEAQAVISDCPTNSFWFSRWSAGCEVRMGFILKQDKAISFLFLKRMILNFYDEIKAAKPGSWSHFKLVTGLTYTILSFVGALRGNEGLKLDWLALQRYLDKGKNPLKKKSKKTIPTSLNTPHIIIPLRGRFKGEQGERCHLIPMTNRTKSGLPLRKTLEFFISARKLFSKSECGWAFINEKGQKLSFSDMNDIVLERMEIIKDETLLGDDLDLTEVEIREAYSINRSFRRGATTHARNMKIPKDTIEAHNRWRKIDRSKGKKPKLEMIEEYSDIEQLIPTLVRFSELL